MWVKAFNNGQDQRRPYDQGQFAYPSARTHSIFVVISRALYVTPIAPRSSSTKFRIFATHQFVVVKSLRWLVRCRLDRFLEKRLAGPGPTRKVLSLTDLSYDDHWRFLVF
jgi:hypothetical protein